MQVLEAMPKIASSDVDEQIYEMQVRIYYRVVFRFRHALALTSPQARSKQGPFPPACCLACLHRYYGPLGLPPGSSRFRPSGFIRSVFA